MVATLHPLVKGFFTTVLPFVAWGMSYHTVEFNCPYIENEIAMTLDIRGSIKNTKLSQNPYVVFDARGSIKQFVFREQPQKTNVDHVSSALGWP